MLKKWLKYMIRFFLLFIICFSSLSAKVLLGIDQFFLENNYLELKGKKVGLITNHTGIDSSMKSSIEKFKENAKEYSLVALFSPEHGINGQAHSWEYVKDNKHKNIPIYSLHGNTRRPTKQMLENIDTLIYDIQEIGSRSFTYLSTLCYAMEEAAKNNISFIVLDRPNPINGLIVDGPMLDEKWRSFIGYINISYCHGMTIGEIAKYFNEEYKIGCSLKVIPMKGWKRSMSFSDTGLCWIPASPHIPEPDTPFYYPSTGILGELRIANIGIGYTLPFKIVGAPWINAEKFAEKLNEQNLPGVVFLPFYFKPFYGLYKGEKCNGVKIQITNKKIYRPLAVQYLFLGLLKSLYPKEFIKRLEESKSSKKLFCQANGNDKIYNILKNEKYPAWKMIEFEKEQRKNFIKRREKYLIEDYPIN
jgi:uncharacterized protein YbbC (DUF1343 family)